MKLEIVDRRTALPDELHDFVERRIAFAMGRYQSRLHSVTVVLEDVNGPRGGVDQLCRVMVRLNDGGQVVITDRDTHIFPCVARAIERSGRTVARRLDRNQAVPRERALPRGLEVLN